MSTKWCSMIQFRARAGVRPSKIAMLLAVAQWLMVLTVLASRIPALAETAGFYPFMYILGGPVVGVWQFCAGIAACLQVRKFPILSALLWLPMLVPTVYPPLVMTVKISKLVFSSLALFTLAGILAIKFIKDPTAPEKVSDSPRGSEDF